MEVGCVLHDKIKSGLWRDDPSERDMTHVDHVQDRSSKTLEVNWF